MQHGTVNLYDYFSLPHRDSGTLTYYVAEENTENAPKKRPAILVIPGGAYLMVSQRESEPVALAFLDRGYDAFVLGYSTKTPYPAPLLEAAMAMVYIRENAKKFLLDREHVAAIGFSAGGHLAGMLATLFDDEHISSLLGERAALVRPDAAVLSYPVISTGTCTHGDTAATISGGDEKLRAALSLEKRVKKNSVPAFIWHTFEDGAVPVENSVLMGNAYRANGVPFELHIFERGCHGLSLHTPGVTDEAPFVPLTADAWFELAIRWLASRGFSVTPAQRY